MDTKAKYEVWIYQSELPTHWFLMIKREGRNQPFVTFEVKSETGADLLPKTRRVKVVSSILDKLDVRLPTPKTVGKIDKEVSLREICSLADAVVREMGEYDMANKNCQDFCNQLLSKLDLPTFQTTLRKDAPEVVREVVSFIGNIVPSALNGSVGLNDDDVTVYIADE